MQPYEIWHEYIAPSASLNAIAYGNGTFVAAGKNFYSHGVLISDDGVNWNAHHQVKLDPNAPEFDILDIIYCDGTFIAITSTPSDAGYGFLPLVSRDGKSWTPATGPNYMLPVSGASRYHTSVVVGSAIATSTDNAVWQKTFDSSASGQLYLLHDICTVHDTSVIPPREFFIAVGSMTVQPIGKDCLFWLTSTDGITWQERHSQGVGMFSSVAFGKGLLVATHSNGKFYTSRDGQNWTGRSHTIRDIPVKIIFADDIFIAIGANGYVYYSSDGLKWNDRSMPGALSLSDICFGENRFVAVNEIGQIFYTEQVDQRFVNVKIEGGGMVTIDEVGVTTRSEWGGAFEDGISLTLRAQGRALKWPLETAFSHWSGAVSGTNPICKLTVNSNNEVTAHFVLKKPIKPPIL